MKIKKLFERIKNLPSYAPSKEVNGLFSELVSKATNTKDEERLTPKEHIRLRDMCAVAEYELEKHWALKISSGENDLLDFPYYENYADLTKIEMSALTLCKSHMKHRILFVGGGPLPMTAIILARTYGLRLTVIDNDPFAAELSLAVIRKLKLDKMIKVVLADACFFEKYQKFNTVFVAALAGAGYEQKERIFRRIKNRCEKETHIIARSSAGKRAMLYAPLPKSVYSILAPIFEISPYNRIINSVVIFKNAAE